MIRPSRPALAWLAMLVAGLIALGLCKALGVLALHALDTIAWGTLLAALVLGLGDAAWLARQPSPTASRRLPDNLALGRWSEATLSLHSHARRALHLRAFDHLPAGLEFEDLPQAFTLPAGGAMAIDYRLRPQRRGPLHFQRCEVQLASPLGLWWQRRWLAVEDNARVYPDFVGLHGSRLLAVDSWLSQLGVRQQPRRGHGLEFNQLRELREGDSLRHVDWKASARHSAPIVREYQEERDQQILLLLDCGQRMRSQDDALSHFDHALNACLLLSHVALRQGDAIGLLTFASEHPRYLPPCKGQGQLNALLDGVYDLDTSQHQADFSEAAQQLLKRQKRRALVILVSNLRDGDEQELLVAVRQISRHHRVLVASLREGTLDELRKTPVQGWHEAVDYCGAIDYLNARDGLHDRLRAQGVPLLDVLPGELGAGLISRYLSWKKAGTL
jgi:uncharacterized protein (DUF58 family)